VNILKTLILGSVMLSPSCFCDCDLEMNDITFYNLQGDDYKISLQIKKVCAPKISYTRSIKDISLKVFLKNKEILSAQFASGLWSPSDNSFNLNVLKEDPYGCFPKLDSLFLNLKKNYLTSPQKYYLSFKDSSSYGLSCLRERDD